MEHSENLLGNDLQVDALVQQHLADSARWARFLAIIGFIFSVFALLAGIISFFNYDNRPKSHGYFDTTGTQELSPLFSAGLIIIAALVWFFISLYTWRFGDKMRTSLANTDQISFTDSLSNLAKHYRMLGIVTIIYLSLIVLGIVAGVLFAAR